MTSSQQTVFRAQHERNYTPIGNNVVRNVDLSLEARYLHISLLTLSKNFKITIRGLVKVLKLSEYVIRKALKELMGKGFIKREQVRERGIIREWITKVFEAPNLDEESIVTRCRFTTTDSASCGESTHIEKKEETNSNPTKEIINTPPISSSEIEPEKEEEEIEIISFLGIKSNSQALTTFKIMFEPLCNALVNSIDQLSATAPPLEKPKINPPQWSTDDPAPIATSSLLRKLSEITREGIESLRTNLGLQKALSEFPQNIEGALDYLEQECKSMKIGVGLVVTALREGRKSKRLGGSTWKEWADRAFDAGLVIYSTAEGNDILIGLKNGSTVMWSLAQTWSWEKLEARATEDIF